MRNELVGSSKKLSEVLLGIIFLVVMVLLFSAHYFAALWVVGMVGLTGIFWGWSVVMAIAWPLYAAACWECWIVHRTWVHVQVERDRAARLQSRPVAGITSTPVKL